MLRTLSDWLYRIANGRVTLAALVVFLLFVVFVLPAQSLAGGAEVDLPVPDLSFRYSADDLYRMAESYGQEGRAAYVRSHFTFDVAWPLVYLAFLSLAISWVYGRLSPPGARLRRVNLMPLAAVLLDLLENVTTSLVMVRYPARTPGVDLLASLSTMAKWILVAGNVVVLLVGVAALLWKRRRPEG